MKERAEQKVYEKLKTVFPVFEPYTYFENDSNLRRKVIPKERIRYCGGIIAIDSCQGRFQRRG